MWAIKNRTPYAAERTWVRDKSGVHHWVIAVKASFDIGADGKLALADEQRPPLRAPEHFGEPGQSSIRYEADLGLMKPATDVLVIGQAHAPHGRAAESVHVSLRIDTLHKVLVVHGDRVYREGLGGIEPAPGRLFVRKPIRYERAFGGTDLSDPDPSKHAHDRRNPIGCGFAVRRRALLDKLAPSIAYPQGDLDKMGPAGFGPLAGHWSPRLELGGTYDLRWTETKSPLLPDDWDDRSTLCAPADQRLPGYLRGGERLELEHLTPGGALRIDLPRIYLTFTTHFGSAREEHRSRLVSVIVEPDDQRLTMVWQTTLRVPARRVDYLDETVVGEKVYVR